MRAILAGGGTGGHVIPALAIAKELQKLYSAEVLFIGTARGIENRLVPAAGFPLRLLPVGGLHKKSIQKPGEKPVSLSPPVCGFCPPPSSILPQIMVCVWVCASRPHPLVV